MRPERLRQLAAIHRAGLFDSVAFWQRHAVDREHGGFFMLLDRDGTRYSDDKPIWLQGRATWLFATLCNRVEPRPEWLELARHGWDFLSRCGPDNSGKLHFCVDRAGRPLRLRRYWFSEVFACLAGAALARATGDPHVRRQAVAYFDTFARALDDPARSAPKTDPATRPMKSLSPLMCLLSLAEELIRTDIPQSDQENPESRSSGHDTRHYEQVIDNCIDEILRDFVKPDRRVVLETVGPRGEFVEGPDGRVCNPGHAIECAWFILEVARRRGDAALVERALPLLDWPFELGWDREYGGLLYFVDVDGRPATQLEHDMKLWWPHCEALYAALLAHHLTGDERYAEMYERIYEWTFARFPDPEHGEWFGYLRRDGSLSTPLKGGMWKGPFHVPRALLLCWQLAEEMAG